LRTRQEQRGSNARRANKSLLASPASQPALRLENRASFIFSDHTISRERHNIEAKRASDAAESAGCSPRRLLLAPHNCRSPGLERRKQCAAVAEYAESPISVATFGSVLKVPMITLP